MGKYIASIIGALALTVTSVHAASNLFEWYAERGQQLPSIEERKELYRPLSLTGEYTGTYDQNMFLLSFLSVQDDMPNPTDIVLGGFNPAAGATYRLKSSIGTTDTTITLSSFKTPVAENEITMTLLNTDIAYGTLDPQSSTRKEFISFTGITQNGDGTAQLTGVTRGLDFVSPFTASTTLRRAHPGQSIFILSDTPQLFEEYAKRRGNTIITGVWNFTALPTSTSTPTGSTQLTTKSYVDNVTNAGAATSTFQNGGILERSTAQEAASSTDNGVSRPQALTSSIAGSGCTGTSSVLVSKSDGKLSTNCLDKVETLHWVGATTFASTTVNGTVNATTTITHATTTTANLVVTGTLSGVSGVASTSVWDIDGTWTKPHGAKSVHIQAWGGGGAGGNGSGVGAGGGGGEYREVWLNAADLAATVAIDIGDSVAGRTTTGNGTTGNDTTFGSHLTAKGGSGGNGTNTTNADVAGGSCGTPFSSIEGLWGAGVAAGDGQHGLYCGAGGGGRGDTDDSDPGGNSYYGGAGGGGAENEAGAASGGTSTHGGAGGAGGNNANATAGSSPGGGGGGARNAASFSSGAGAAGRIVVTTYF